MTSCEPADTVNLFYTENSELHSEPNFWNNLILSECVPKVNWKRASLRELQKAVNAKVLDELVFFQTTA